jgi:hypothetical protein
VTLIRNIDNELRAVWTGIGRASELAVEAATAAGRIAARAQASGFAGVAQRMTRVQDSIKKLHGRIAVVAWWRNVAAGPPRSFLTARDAISSSSIP